MHAPLIAFDFETSGLLPEYALQPWRAPEKAWATSLAVVTQDAGGELRISGGLNPGREMMRAMLEEAVERKAYIAGWNVIFDIQWLFAYGLGDLVRKVRWLDGMLFWKHATNEPAYEAAGGKKRSYGLKECVRQHLPVMAGYEENVDFHDESPDARAKLHEYNINDTIATYLLTQRWWGELTPKQLGAALIEAECLPTVAQANFEGLAADYLSVNELEAYLGTTAADALTKLADQGVSETILRSPTQLGSFLRSVWGLKLPKLSSLGNPSVAKEVVHELALIDERVKLIEIAREAMNNRTKFATKLRASLDYNNDGRTRPQAIVFGTYTGRMTYSSKQGKGKEERQIGFAIHQEKRSSQYRANIVAPPGYTLLEFDAAGQEFRWMAIQSGDETMLALCMPGEDAHSYMAARIHAEDYHELMRLHHENDASAKKRRNLGKLANLSLQYRTSAQRLCLVARTQYDLPMQDREAVHIRNTYLQAYPGVQTYWAKRISMAKRLHYAETLAGRRVRLEGDWSARAAWSLESTAINYPIQGTGADQRYLALAVLRPYLTKIGARLAFDLHDGIYVYAPKFIAEKAGVKIKGMLDNLPYKKAWGFDPPIALPWDFKIGPSWGELREFKS